MYYVLEISDPRVDIQTLVALALGTIEFSDQSQETGFWSS